MKKAVALALISGAMVPGLALAADGNMSFTGNVTANTCVINSPDLTIDMGDVPASALATPGARAGQTRFEIALTGCTEGVAKVAAKFESGTADLSTGRLGLTADVNQAKNVQIAIYDMADAENKFGQAPPTSSYQDIISGSATLRYSAWYVATGVATVGTANAAATYTLAYE
ncbi:fimbrial protein [Chromobacterium haemolyticum]|uniref:Fimbrial-type adhesion domain-containing protein n=1 Tax=Chromobacterium haemolyticum TaxID=394935 RepID=A0A1W0CEP5_9NEIS|nr:fimbrial protein [Chromobacterium haemolyticum]OQS33207.1 hypothetical protein B0T45_20550 [Chromobacterium haemolyticum]